VLPLVGECADLVVSNYCFHHLSDEDKLGGLDDIRRVLRPAGKLVLADMMFRPGLTDPRDRPLVASKTKAMIRKGPAGYLRLAKNAARFLAAALGAARATGLVEGSSRPSWIRGGLGRRHLSTKDRSRTAGGHSPHAGLRAVAIPIGAFFRSGVRTTWGRAYFRELWRRLGRRPLAE
jgi:SAM-dependent methyltransferase